MGRVKGGVTTKRRRKKAIKLADGFYGRKKNAYKGANELLMRSWRFSYKGRKLKKRDFRKLWIIRINAACRENGISYSRFINGLKKAEVLLNRKQLAELAVSDNTTFVQLVDIAKENVLVSTS